MPGLITHNFFSNDVIEKLDKNELQVIDKHFDAYQIGAQGPDVLFGLRLSAAPFRRFANAVHYEKCFETFEAAARYIENSGDEAAFSFMLGMAGHYALDKTVHPYVYHKVRGEMKDMYPPQYDDSSRHILLETHLDNFVADELAEGGYDGVLRGGSLIPSDKRAMESLDALFVNAVAPVYGVPLKKGMAARSARRTKSFFAVTNGAAGITYFIAERLEKAVFKNKAITGYFLNGPKDERLDAPNFGGGIWYSELGGNLPTRENFPEMLERAKAMAPIYAKQFYERVAHGAPMDENLFELNYNGERLDGIKKNAPDFDGQGQHRKDL